MAKFEYVPKDDLHFPTLLVKLIEEIKKRFPLEIDLKNASKFKAVKIFRSIKYEDLFCGVSTDEEDFFWEDKKIAFFVVRGNYTDGDTFTNDFYDRHLFFICNNMDECRTILECIRCMP
jgi:hypothetical protein